MYHVIMILSCRTRPAMKLQIGVGTMWLKKACIFYSTKRHGNPIHELLSKLYMVSYPKHEDVLRFK